MMGILNCTPDSFSDGGKFTAADAALRQVESMAAAGAAIIDIGGESTRPGAAEVSEQEEIDRVAPVIEASAAITDVPISIDTSKPGVMRAAVAAGAAMINDVRALQSPGSLQAAAELDVPVCLMHMRGEPRTMQDAPDYADVVDDVSQFLQERIAACLTAGMTSGRLIVDPGFGFGKTLAHNLTLLRNLDQIVALGYPLLVGLSRKSMLGQILDRPVDQRLYGGLTLALIARQKGASIVRVHDVAQTVDALRVLQAVSD